MALSFKVLRRASVSVAAFAVLTVTWIAAIAPAAASASSTPNTALINRDSITTADGFTKGEEAISLEQYAAEQAGYTVTVKTGSEWDAMSAEEFAKYQVLIVGDPKCNETPASAISDASTWTPVVMGTAGGSTLVGNRIIVGTDPEYHYPAHHGAEHLVQDGITFAGGVAGATGIYFDTSCEDPGAKEEEIEGKTVVIPGEDVTKVFDNLTVTGPGHWTENFEPPCGGSVQQIAENPAFDSGPTKLEDSDIQGWSCSDHITYPAFPGDWNALAVATDTPTHPTCGTDPTTKEGACGEAYVLVAGQSIVATSPNLKLTPPVGGPQEGGTHSVTATVQETEVETPASGTHSGALVVKPAVGASVTFVVTGRNSGVQGKCTFPGGGEDPECKTDSNGEVVFTYPDTNGAGEDTINASVKVRESTEHATATMTWLAVPTPAPTPAVTPAAKPVAVVLAAKESVQPSGTAHTSRVRSCIASSGYTASVRGSSIASVTFTLDGHKVKTLRKPTSAGTFAAHVSLRSGRTHHLSMQVVFTASSKTAATTLHKTLARCAAVRRVLPTFTG